MLIRKKRNTSPNFCHFTQTNSYHWKVFLPIWNNISEQNCLDKPVFDIVNRLYHSSPMNNTLTNKIKHFLQLFALGQEISLKRKWYNFFP